jgi:DNA-binding response OmpR family regulator
MKNKSKVKILTVEDEHVLAVTISDYLKLNGYICEIAHNILEAQDKIATSEYDCILIDIGLPDGSGLDIIKMIKGQESRAGILVISAKNSLDDKILGLEIGADDYLSKPFHLSELNARIKSIYRRRNFSGSTSIQFNEIRISTDEKQAYINDSLLDLTRKEYDLLLYFIANKGRIINKESIVEHLWGSSVMFADSYEFIYTHVKNLRNKISAKGGNDYIKTVYGIGYKFSDQ